MKSKDSAGCAVCGASAAAAAPLLVVEQLRHMDCPLEHRLALCPEHGEALRAGELTPHSIIYEWTRRQLAEIYDGTRLVLVPTLTCLACNASLTTPAEGECVPCPACGARNQVGSALGHPTAIRLETP